MREEGSLKISNGERPNPIKTTVPQRVYANNLVTQPGVYNEPLPLVEGMECTISPPLGLSINKGQQIPRLLCSQLHHY